MDIPLILSYAFPGSWVRAAANYTGDGSDLQSWLDDNIEWTGAPVTAAEIIAAEAAFIAWRDAKLQEVADEAADEVAIKGDATVRNLITARPAQIEAYITNNVTDLASARDVLTILAKAVSVLGKQVFKAD